MTTPQRDDAAKVDTYFALDARSAFLLGLWFTAGAITALAVAAVAWVLVVGPFVEGMAREAGL